MKSCLRTVGPDPILCKWEKSGEGHPQEATCEEEGRGVPDMARGCPGPAGRSRAGLPMALREVATLPEHGSDFGLHGWEMTSVYFLSHHFVASCDIILSKLIQKGIDPPLAHEAGPETAAVLFDGQAVASSDTRAPLMGQESG